MSSDSADPFYWMRVILASNRGLYFFSFASMVVLTANKSGKVETTIFDVYREGKDMLE